MKLQTPNCTLISVLFFLNSLLLARLETFNNDFHFSQGEKRYGEYVLIHLNLST